MRSNASSETQGQIIGAGEKWREEKYEDGSNGAGGVSLWAGGIKLSETAFRAFKTWVFLELLIFKRVLYLTFF